MKKKILAALFTAMVLMMSCACALAHSSHKICGVTGACSHGGTTHSSSVSWTAWDGTTSRFGLGTSTGTAYVYLTKDVTLSSTITLSSGQHVYLCLNGYDLIIQPSSTSQLNAVTVYSGASFTMTDCQSTQGSLLHANYDTGLSRYCYGRAVSVSGTFNLYGGVIRDHITTSMMGVGVYVSGSSAVFNMYGGSITENLTDTVGVVYATSGGTVNLYGGDISNNQCALYESTAGCAVYAGSSCKLNIYGGTVTNNDATGVIVAGATAKMTGGTISRNTAFDFAGGGVKLSGGTFTMSGGKIEDNDSWYQGSGVMVHGGTFTLSGGEIVDNGGSHSGGAYHHGGGVAVEGGTFTMSGGKIASNTVTSNGGGVYVTGSGAFTMRGGEITGNHAYKTGGGVYTDVGMTLGGSSAKITGNSCGAYGTQQYVSNIHLASGQEIMLSSLSGGAFGVTTETKPTAWANVNFLNRGTSSVTSSQLKYFTSDDPAYLTALTSSSPYKGMLTMAALHTHAACGATASGSSCGEANHSGHANVTWMPWDGTYRYEPQQGDNYIYLTRDVKSTAQTQVESGERVFLCLNGHDFIYTPESSQAFCVYSGGELIICDCAAESDWGKISNGGYTSFGVARVYGSGATLTLYGGKISDSLGGGVQLESGAVMNMYGGEISGNESGQYNYPGVYLRKSTLNMYGGRIVNNTNTYSGGKGAGVQLFDDLYNNESTMNMYGGEISGNTLTSGSGLGAGVYVGARNTLNVKGGAIISGNKAAGKASNAYLGSGTTMTRKGALTGSIGVSTAVLPSGSTPVSIMTGATSSDLGHILSDAGYDVRLSGSTAQLIADQTKYAVTVAGGSASISEALAGTGVTVTADAPQTGYAFDRWDAQGVTLTSAQKTSAQMTFTMPGGDVTLTAVYEKIVYPITYDLQGGSLPSGRRNPESYTVTDSFTLHNPEKTGYTFMGWTGTGLDAAAKTVTIAAGSTGARTYKANWAHMHLPCGEADCAHSGHEEIAYTEWDGKSSKYLSSGVNNIVLTGTPQYTLRVESGQTLNLCLNGHAYDYDYSGTLISVQAGGVLNLCDCTGGGTMRNISTNGRALFVYGTANLYDITVTGCAGWPAVSAAGEGSALYMYGGSVSGNRGHSDGCAIYGGDGTHGSVYLSGVRIENNDNSYDDGYGTIRMDGGVLTIEDSVITGNSSTARGAIALYYNCVATLKDTQITGNSTDTDSRYNGGGVNAYSDTVDLRIGGSTTITGNTAGGEVSNLYLGSGATITRESALTGRIGVNTEVKPTEDMAVDIASGMTESDMAHITSDEGYDMRLVDSTAQLYVKKPTFAVTVINGFAQVSEAEAGAEVTVQAEALAEGYMFSHWEAEGLTLTEEQAASAQMTFTMPANAVTLTAVCGLAEYAIAYDLAGGVLAEGAVNPQSYTVETPAFTLVAPVREGYTFTGWTGSCGEEPALEVTVPAGTTGDLAYTANWTQAIYTVTLLPGEGAGEAVTAEVVHGESYTLEACAFAAPQRHVFSHWLLETENGGEMHQPGDVFAAVTADMTFTAVWEALPVYAVTVINGFAPVSEAAEGESVTVQAEDLAEGYAFLRWEAEGLTLTEEEAASPQLTFTMPANAVTLTAVCGLAEYAITYDLAGGIMQYGEENPTSYTIEDSFTLRNPICAGREFIGWTGTDLTEPTLEVTIPAGSTGDRAYTANWKDVLYTITFDTDGGTEIQPMELYYMDPVTPPENPAKEGYTFIRWEPELPQTMISSNLTVTAIWEPILYTLTFDTNGGTEIKPVLACEGELVFEPEPPTKEGYTFYCWEDEYGSRVFFPFEMPAYDVTLKARWLAPHGHDGVDFHPWFGDVSTLLNGGSYYMIEETSIGETIVVPEGVTLNLCLNDAYMYSYAEGMFVVNGTLRLYDCGWYGTSRACCESGVALTVNEGGRCELYDAVGMHQEDSRASVIVNRGTIECMEEKDRWISYSANAGTAAVENYGSFAFGGIIDQGDRSKAESVVLHNHSGATAVLNHANFRAYKGTAIRNEGDLTFEGDTSAISSSARGVDHLGGMLQIRTNIGFECVERDIYLADGLKIHVGGSLAQHLGTILVLHEKQAEGAPVIDFLTADNMNEDLLTHFESAAEGYSMRVKPGDSTTGQLYIPYSIVYDLAGGRMPEGASNPAAYAMGDSFTLVNPEREGYAFTGWTGTGLTEPTLEVTIPAGTTGNLTYTANWTAAEYAIAYDLAGGSLPEGAGNPAAYAMGDSFTLVNPVREGYTFAGWTGTGLTEPTVAVTIPAGTTGDLTYTANWTANLYTITFNTDRGTPIAPIQLAFGESIPWIEPPQRTGHSFAGWSPELPETMPAHDLTVTAQWSVEQYRIEFIVIPGVHHEEYTIDYGTRIPVPEIPEREGYVFIGWDREIPTIMPAQDLTITAMWQALNSEGAEQFGANLYKVFRKSYTWNDARALCEEMGGHLATITSAEEQAFIESLSSEHIGLWIGGYRDDAHNWYWVTGEAWGYTNWGEGEPNNMYSENGGAGEQCAAIWPQRWNDLSWDSEEQEGFICEWEGEPITPPQITDVVTLPGALLVIDEEAFAGSGAQAFVIGEGCAYIASRAFADCRNLLKVTLPESVSSIAEDAFEGCRGFVIEAPSGSYALEYAKKHGYAYIVL